jgi:hypothetical protein
MTLETENAPAAAADTAGTSVIGVLVNGSSSLFLSDVRVIAGNGGSAGAASPSADGTGTECNGGSGNPGANGAVASGQGTFGAGGFTPGDGMAGAPGSTGSNGIPQPPPCVPYSSACLFGCVAVCTSSLLSNVCAGPAQGGCGGVGGAAGAPGHGGGASAALVVAGSHATVRIANSSLQSGQGGAGSAGAYGGTGALGTDGSAGTTQCATALTCGITGSSGSCTPGNFLYCGVTGSSQVCATGPAAAPGAEGGRGGVGGSGAGGPSYALVNVAGALVSLDNATTLSAGLGGAGALAPTGLGGLVNGPDGGSALEHDGP